MSNTVFRWMVKENDMGGSALGWSTLTPARIGPNDAQG